MKKFIILNISFLLSASMIFGQGEKTDHSELFPKAGTYSIGMDMANILQFIGNSFSANGNSNYPNYSMIEPSWTAVSVSNTLYGRYFLTDNTAMRFRLGLGVDNFTERAFIYDDVANLDNPLNEDPLTYAKTVDEYKKRNNRVELGIGYEWRKNLWRMQGYAGAEVFGAYIRNRSTYTYGNAMSSTNQTPTTYNFGSNLIETEDLDEMAKALAQNATHRVLETNGGDIIHYGGGLYAGADFFITKTISLGIEYNLFIFGSMSTEETGVIETYKLEQVYNGEMKITPVNTGFQTLPVGLFNLNVYFYKNY